MCAKKATGKKRNPSPKTEHLKAHQWKKGQSGNPTGRPKSLISDASRDWLRQFDQKTGKTNAELVAVAQGKKALEGETNAYCAIRDTTEGRPAQTQQHEIIQGSPVKVEVEAPNLIAAIRQIYGLSRPDSAQPAEAKPVPESVDSGQVAAKDSDQGA